MFARTSCASTEGSSSCEGDSPFTEACVPTGMNIGVLQAWCGKCRVHARALFQVAWISRRSAGVDWATPTSIVGGAGEEEVGSDGGSGIMREIGFGSRMRDHGGRIVYCMIIIHSVIGSKFH